MRTRTVLFAVALASAIASCASNDETSPPGLGGKLDLVGGAGGQPSAGGTGGGGAATGGAAGMGGKSGGSGKSGASGTAGTAGASGAGGMAGSAGAAGAGTSGSGGEGGSAGVAGEGGAAGTAGGAGGGGTGGGGGAGAAGVGGTAGSAGMAGTAGSQSGAGGVPLGPADIVVDQFNGGLEGTTVLYTSERKMPVADAIAALDSDVVCVEDVFFQADKDMIVNAAKNAGTLVNSVTFLTKNDTAPSVPTDVNGNTPPVPSMPPCGGVEAAKLDAALTCLETNCSTMPGSDQGTLTSTSCAQQKCSANAAALLLGTQADKTCYGCLAPQLVSENFATIKTTCENDLNGGLGFQGQNSVIMLSKHPIANAELFVLPSSWLAHVVIKATIMHPHGPIDVYCAHTSAVYTGFLYPYTGPWGAGPDSNGWQNELLNQANQVVSYVNGKSSGPAIIAADFNASPDVKDAMGNVVSKPDGADAIAVLTNAFPEALAPGYAPACTFCPDNANIPSSDVPLYTPEWIDHILLKGIPVANVKATLRTFTAATVPVTDANGNAIMVPVSDHYGMRSVITLP